MYLRNQQRYYLTVKCWKKNFQANESVITHYPRGWNSLLVCRRGMLWALGKNLAIRPITFCIPYPHTSFLSLSDLPVSNINLGSKLHFGWQHDFPHFFLFSLLFTFLLFIFYLPKNIDWPGLKTCLHNLVLLYISVWCLLYISV